MEGKRGILAVLIILSALFLIAGIVFGVCFAVGLTDVFANNEVWLYLCVGSIGIFVLSSLGAIIAHNSIITADNTYDILCRIDALLKEKGLTDADIARRDLKRAEKIAKKEAALKAKLEAKALKDILEENKRAEAAARKVEEKKTEEVKEETVEDIAEEIVSDEVTESIEKEVSSDEISIDILPVEETVEVIPESIEEVPTETVEEVNETVVNDEINNDDPSVIEPIIAENEEKQPISYEDWKKGLEGRIVCAECGGIVRAYKTKSGQIVLSCVTARKEPDKCSSNKKLSIDQFSEAFIAFYNEFFGAEINSFDFDLFDSKIEKTEINDGKIRFVAKIDSISDVE